MRGLFGFLGLVAVVALLAVLARGHLQRWGEPAVVDQSVLPAASAASGSFAQRASEPLAAGPVGGPGGPAAALPGLAGAASGPAR